MGAWLRRRFSKPSIPLSDEELKLLRLVVLERPERMFYEGEAGFQAGVDKWLLAKSNRWIQTADHSPGNSWFFETLKTVQNRRLVTETSVLALTDLGLKALGEHRGRKIKSNLSLVLMHAKP